MVSEKQLAANRANARKSRGPITPGGRRNSSRNAIKHGIFAQTILLPGESRRRFLRLLAVLTTEFHATTPNELALVETMAFCRWRTLRNWTFQAAQLAREQTLQADSAAHEDPPTRALLALNALNQPPSLLETLSRQEIRLDRQYHRAADRLARLKLKKDGMIPLISMKTNKTSDNQIPIDPSPTPEQPPTDPPTTPDQPEPSANSAKRKAES